MDLEQRRVPEKIAQLLALIEPEVYCRWMVLPPFELHLLPAEDSDPWEDACGKGETILPGDMWGPPRTSFVLKTTFSVPSDWQRPVVLHMPFGEAGDFSHPEALVYVDGEPWASSDRHHQEIPLEKRWMDGREHSLLLHGWTGGIDLPPEWGGKPRHGHGGFLQMRTCRLAEVHQPARNFHALAALALGVANRLEWKQPERASLMHALLEAFAVLDTRSPLGEAFYSGLPGALQVLQDGIRRSGSPQPVDITATGHAHIDVAWLWTLQQSRHKARRTFSNVIRLMERYPEFVFAQSQAQLYDFIRQDDPQLFDCIRLQVREGRWQPVGGMWVESDCNLTGPESLVRQFLLGRAFFQQHFPEVHSRVLWLPDVFGFSWNLPQLAKEAGLDYFFTTKMGWNETNRLPFESFWWQGLDGSRLLTHFSTVPWQGIGYSSTYNANVTAEEMVGSWDNTLQKDAGRVGEALPVLMSYGFGDGGGGPTQEMLDTIRMLESFPAVPRVHCGTPDGFFKDLEERFGSSLPVWNDELYLEHHRGTFTTHAAIKQANRRSEFALHDAEFLGTAASLLDSGCAFPAAHLRHAWELVCLNQFHDILPGSSIHQVYLDAEEQYREVARLAGDARTKALQSIARNTGGALLLVNPTSFSCSQPVFVPAGPGAGRLYLRQDGSPCVRQSVEGGVLLDAGMLPPYSAVSLEYGERLPSESPGTLSAAQDHLENELLRLEFSPHGDLVRIFDKEQNWEVLEDGAVGNALQLFEDRPADPDAWDISMYYEDRMWPAEAGASVEVIETGPLRAALRIIRKLHNSTITQCIRLQRGNRRIDFDTTVDWQEQQMLLKAAFPVRVLAPQAACEIQWGNIERPTHRNTSWQQAMFEIPAQKWIDLSEGGCGVSLLNDGKYGHDVRDHVLRITLLRAPQYPDPQADRGIHHFCYSLLPHPGSWGRDTAAQAYLLNDPVISHVPEEPTPLQTSRIDFFRLEPGNLILETVKPAEDGRGWIVRLYDFQRRRGTGKLACGFSVREAWRTTILEEDQEQLDTSGSVISFPFRPYEVITLRLLLQT